MNGLVLAEGRETVQPLKKSLSFLFFELTSPQTQLQAAAPGFAVGH